MALAATAPLIPLARLPTHCLCPPPSLPLHCSETCKLEVLAGLPRLQQVYAAGYGEYTTEGLPPSVRDLSLQVRAAAAALWGRGQAAGFRGPARRLAVACCSTCRVVHTKRMRSAAAVG